MSEPLYVGEFTWISAAELNQWENQSCILEVDLEYPKELHNLQNEYPLAPERLRINKVDKLIRNLNNKETYIVRHKNLKLYLSLGLKLTKIHRGIKFTEEPWLAKYIQLNSQHGLTNERNHRLRKGFLQINE